MSNSARGVARTIARRLSHPPGPVTVVKTLFFLSIKCTFPTSTWPYHKVGKLMLIVSRRISWCFCAVNSEKNISKTWRCEMWVDSRLHLEKDCFKIGFLERARSRKGQHLSLHSNLDHTYAFWKFYASLRKPSKAVFLCSSILLIKICPSPDISWYSKPFRSTTAAISRLAMILWFVAVWYFRICTRFARV